MEIIENMIDPVTPSEAFLRSIDIHELLPQQEPFVMISRLVQFDKVRTVCETDINADNIFVEDGRFTASGLIENIAQTCAARIGYFNKYVLKKAVQIGFIGAIRNMEITDLPEVGQQDEENGMANATTYTDEYRLECADYVKFAKHVASQEENARALPTAVRFVTSTYQTVLEEEQKTDDEL